MALKDGHSEKKTDSIRVTVACTYPLLREGLNKILREDKRIEIVANASNLLDLVQFCEECKFDILLLDTDLRGLNLTRILNLLKKNKSTKVILILADGYDEYNLLSAIRYGVRGYLLRNTDSTQLTKAIKSVNDGELWVERKTMAKVLETFSISPKGKKNKGGSSIYNLTETETKIVKLVLTGLSNKDIAKDIYLSEKTVKFHLYKIFKKLSVKNRSSLILYGIKQGFIT
jgi:DNA-binding NarL/FixJ family response regulator